MKTDIFQERKLVMSGVWLPFLSIRRSHPVQAGLPLGGHVR